jgi:hypothetical protein
MSTLETQYKNFLSENPENKFTFDEWREWHGNSILSQTETLWCHKHSISKKEGECSKCLEENNK